MNYRIIFSTYINSKNTSTPRKKLEQQLVALAKKHGLQGFSLSEQLGYWAGTLEQSHILTLLDIQKDVALNVATDIKSMYEQDAVIVEPINNITWFI
jgi:hypothetical protein